MKKREPDSGRQRKYAVIIILVAVLTLGIFLSPSCCSAQIFSPGVKTSLLHIRDKTWESIDDLIYKNLITITYVRFKEGYGLIKDGETGLWVLSGDEGKITAQKDIVHPDTVIYASIRVPGDADPKSNKTVYSLVESQWGESAINTSFIEKVAFRRNAHDNFILSVITSDNAEIFIPPFIGNLKVDLINHLKEDPGIIHYKNMETYDLKAGWQYGSSTDIQLWERSGDGSWIAKGQMEYLMLSWKRLFRNFGVGARIKIETHFGGSINLIDAGGTMCKVSEGAFVNVKGKWEKTD